MFNRFAMLFCDPCGRDLPRAAVRCVWCLGPLQSYPAETDGQERVRNSRIPSTGLDAGAKSPVARP